MKTKIFKCLMPVMIMPSQVIDGDTIRSVKIPLKLGISIEKNVRLVGIDTPEKNEEGFKKASEALREYIGFCNDLKIEIFGEDSFGRILANLYCGSININQRMILKGYAKPFRKEKK